MWLLSIAKFCVYVYMYMYMYVETVATNHALFSNILLDTFYLFYYSRCFFLFADYLLSNNSVNSIIIHKFDFSDEEVRCLFFKFYSNCYHKSAKTLCEF